MERAGRRAGDKREPVGPTIESRGLIFVFRLEMLSRSMSRVDRKEEEEKEKGNFFQLSIFLRNEDPT